MSITVAGIVADELFEDYSKGIPGAPRVEKKYLVPWAQSDAFANAIMGLSGSVAVGGPIFRTYAHACPESPNLFALGIGQIEGCGMPTVADGRPAWEWAIVPVTYGPVALGGIINAPDPNNFNTPDGQAYEFCTFEVDYSTESITIPKTSMKRAEGGVLWQNRTIDVPWTVRIPTATIVCTVHKVPWLPTDAILGLQGRVNDRTFFGRPAGTILFDGARTRRSYSSDGTITQDIAEVYKYNEKGWNRVVRPDNMTIWDLVTHNGDPTGNTMYASDDLRPLIFGVTLT